MQIQVTKEDIKFGKPRSPCHCPVSLALTRAGFRSPYVAPRSVTYGEDESRVTARFPATVNQFIDFFDHGVHCEPFSFELDRTIWR